MAASQPNAGPTGHTTDLSATVSVRVTVTRAARSPDVLMALGRSWRITPVARKRTALVELALRVLSFLKLIEEGKIV